MKTYKILLTYILIVICLGCKEQTSLQFEGIVKSDTGNVIQMAIVRLGKIGFTASDYELLNATLTDKNGHYRLEYTFEDDCPASLLAISAFKEYSNGSTNTNWSSVNGDIFCIDDLQIFDISLVCAFDSCPE